jgi:signal transduction histidine kinase
VVAAIRNTRGDFLSPSLWIARPGDLEILEAAPAEPFETPQVPLGAIGRYRLEPVTGHRLQTEGTVTCALPGRFFYLQQGLNGLRVQTSSDASFVPGDRVRVAGFLDMSRQSASIVEALVKKIGHEDPPKPHAIEPDDLVRLNTEARRAGVIAEPSNFDGCLVSFSAKLVEVNPMTPGKVQLILTRGASTVPAVFDGLDISPFMQLLPGSELEVTGVMQIHLQGAEEMASFAADPVIQQLGLQLRSAADVRVLATPSWWTPRRLVALLAGVLALLAGMLAWVWLLRREIAAQSALLVREMGTRRDAAVEFQATLRERNRMAANLHDTLLQTLTGIRFQLGACRKNGRLDGDDTDEHLAVARKMVDLAAQELRESVWGLRTAPMEGQSFMDSLSAIVKHLGRGHDERIECRSTGTPFVVRNFVAGNLLLCAQEAVHNALQHAGAKAIEVLVDFDPSFGTVKLSVRDDGSGFAPGNEVGPEQGHFGLTGMRERIERLGGTFTLDTTPGRGTTVCAQVCKRDYDSLIDGNETAPAVTEPKSMTPT